MYEVGESIRIGKVGFPLHLVKSNLKKEGGISIH